MTGEERSAAHGERWLPVVGFEGLYEVSDQGRVRLISGEVSTGRAVDAKGYRCMVLRGPDGRRSVRVHRLVLEAFVGPCPEGMQTRHGPGGPSDNRLVNLSWGTKRENNYDDKLRDGTLLYGERHHRAKLTQEQVEEIRDRVGTTTQRAMARKYGVSEATISLVIHDKHWRPR